MNSNAGNLSTIYNREICDMNHCIEDAESQRGVARFCGVQLSSFHLYKDVCIGKRRSARTRGHIKKDGVQDFLISLTLGGRTWLRQSGRQTLCEPGQFRVLSVASPFVAISTAERTGAAFSQIVLRVPGALLRREVPGIDELSNSVLDIRPGAGRIMQQLIDLGFSEGENLSAGQAADFSNMLLHSLTGVVMESPQYRSLHCTGVESPKKRLIRVGLEYIGTHLSDPFMTCASIADHCQVSARYLQVTFRELLGTTTVAYIRNQRLQMCQRDISDPALQQTSITNTALQWGFESLPAFSRAYRARYGNSPSFDKATTRKLCSGKTRRH